MLHLLVTCNLWPAEIVVARGNLLRSQHRSSCSLADLVFGALPGLASHIAVKLTQVILVIQLRLLLAVLHFAPLMQGVRCSRHLNPTLSRCQLLTKAYLSSHQSTVLHC